MNINYDEIITKANERAEKLKVVQEYAKGIDDKAHELLDLMLYFANLGNKAQAVDAEGRQLLPGSLKAYHIGNWASGEYSRLTDGPKHMNILELVKEMK